MSARPVSSALWWSYGGAILVFMTLPLILVVLFSFNSSALTSLPLTGLTFDWYRKLFTNAAFWPALANSLIVGTTVAVASAVVGTLCALALSRLPPRGAGSGLSSWWPSRPRSPGWRGRSHSPGGSPR